jgi:hypothetical protein
MSESELHKVECSEWLKLVRCVLVLVVVSVEDERLFSAMNFVRNRLRKALTVHLELCLSMKTQSLFRVGCFPYEEALMVHERRLKAEYAEQMAQRLQARGNDLKWHVNGLVSLNGIFIAAGGFFRANMIQFLTILLGHDQKNSRICYNMFEICPKTVITCSALEAPGNPCVEPISGNSCCQLIVVNSP